jgi:hypothetical protein
LFEPEGLILHVISFFLKNTWLIPLETYQLPHSEIEISRLIFGCWAIVGGFNWGRSERKLSSHQKPAQPILH